ncbi:hypothetical protein SAMN04488543_1304 [Friedmanniella luteola]|uniref:Uncharacterized protein n=1 Tax=Friedmanniella luteola TaxID=546871 RepID=A0A1H1QF23_9ACTN|nr:hypothetical protein [Friedmanniella luteola]SDS22025.1 hypothetical protein SAMN04488543_1304 [Friedmanniella luteola]
MTMTHSQRSQRRLDAAGLVLLLIGLASGVFAYWLIADRGLNALILVPSVIASYIGATHLTKREALRSR